MKKTQSKAPEYLARERLALEAKLKEIKKRLPHLHGWPFYKWSREFFESKNKENFLTSGNQLSKSSTAIRKCIHWATEKSLWPTLWPEYARNDKSPNLFWYFYPDQKTLNAEFSTKWAEFLPKYTHKEHPVYGWKIIKNGTTRDVAGIAFNSGVTVYFKFYSQALIALQASSVFALLS